jgi:phospho-N-acetylmuramoyl-pentapeptide-transferase
MLYYLLYHMLQKYFSPLNVFRYITVRTAYASLTAMFLALVFGPWLIRKLRELQIGQYIAGVVCADCVRGNWVCG